MTQFAPLQNDTFLRALLRQPVPYTPQWLMRQAGRYLPEYCATRKQAGSFLNLCKNPELACEVTLQPLRRYPLDAAILFSDILTVPDAMGLGLYFAEGEGPKFDRPLRTEADVAQLRAPDVHSTLGYVFDAVTTIRHALGGKVPLIGFSGSPWTLACYMVEGGGSDDFRTIKTMLYQRPDLLKRIIEVNVQAVADYLNAQIAAGAQAVMVFDTWGGVLADGLYQTYSLNPMREVLSRLTREVDGQVIPRIVFTKGGGIWLEEIAKIGTDGVGLDWTVNLQNARQRTQDQVALQGNMDPFSLFGTPAAVEQEAKRVLEGYGQHTQHSGHVFNLGHGINQFTPPENVAVLAETVRNYSRKFHTNVNL
ncbi:uroporphyrinogen decarboxylase [Parvibium lacunae]|uniref:Uroporphyrinogen decarboxylase n=1 Tax=Parvibium lacunae TaxID=1888893 RepID=A0A368KZV5_9BURK|nr:uroporphyrinogen decarboxylase [Parvibium lacunae]RCS56654.1 uroporphyrinogen decarboxylase [Parvibium lacunae]